MFQAWRQQRLWTVCLLGFSSGLPLALTGSTLQAWFTVSGIDIVTIGLLALVGQPYVFKFMWAPLLDRYIPPLLGRRRGWMVITQLVLMVFVLSFAFMSPNTHPGFIACVAVAIAFFSATQDIAVDAYRADILKPEERGLGAAFSVTGYRVAMLVSGGIALILADYFGWTVTFVGLAFCLCIGVFAAWRGEEPFCDAQHTPNTLKTAVIEPFKAFLKRDRVLWILAFIVLYKLGDAFAGTLTIAFLKRGVDFSLTDIGAIYKTTTLVTTLLGIFLGGALLMRLGLFKALMGFGVLQALSNLTFMWLAMVGKDYTLMITAVALENLAGGMGTAAFVAYLMGLCDRRYTATQFALLSALASLGRVFVAPLGGVLVDNSGWAVFFGWTFLAAIPGLLVLGLIKSSVDQQGLKGETEELDEELYEVRGRSI